MHKSFHPCINADQSASDGALCSVTYNQELLCLPRLRDHQGHNAVIFVKLQRLPIVFWKPVNGNLGKQ